MSTVIEKRKKESYKIFDEIASTYDLLNRILSGGIDIYWRQRLIRKLPLNNELLVLDLATGTADMALGLAKQNNVKKVIGLDLSTSMLEIGRKKIAKKGLSHKCELKLGDGCHPEFPENSFDVVTLTYGLRNFSKPQTALNNIYKVLKPGGCLLIEEFGLPSHFLVKTIYLFYFRQILPRIGHLFSRHRNAYSYLNQTVEHFPYGKELLLNLKKAGFQKTESNPMTFGISYLYLAYKDLK